MWEKNGSRKDAKARREESEGEEKNLHHEGTKVTTEDGE
jgi:hypothetical protein